MVRRAFRVAGVIQGVGFRPFVYNAAHRNGLTGWVRNEAGAVRIEVQGEQGRVEGFRRVLECEHPPMARVEIVDVETLQCVEEAAFRILDSTRESAPRPTIPPDLAVCAECLAEVWTSGCRRHRYPFTNCTTCGPRLSIVEGLPYDRSRTGMRGFAMCGECAREYSDPADRRFHAQPIACPRCGPTLSLLDAAGHEMERADSALRKAAAALTTGLVVAVKGLGGFQLLVDATNGAAVARLRGRKHRPAKPFAVMAPSLHEARAICELSPEEEAALLSPAAPILLARRRGQSDVAVGVAPGNPYLGLMLPYTPLHALLMAEVGRIVVCTSGNLSEEPMCIDSKEALARLGGVADLFLVHDRPVARPVDDSVVRVGPDGPEVLRRARGYAPLPVAVPGHGLMEERLLSSPPARWPASVLALGGHMKSTVALTTDGGVVMSPHIGDLEAAASVAAFRRAIGDLLDFYEARPDIIACDLHPDYASTAEAERLAADRGVPLVRVQHHHAHVAACAAEHGLSGPVLGLAWDGTGYGTDKVAWGGEALVMDGARFARVAHLRPFGLIGGEGAVREPRRAALAALWEAAGPEAVEVAPVRDLFDPVALDVFARLCGSGRVPRTTSMGRLFDAVSAVCGLCSRSTFEGEAAALLEFAAEEAAGERVEPYEIPMVPGRPATADWLPLFRTVLDDRADGVPVAVIARRFHEALAVLAVDCARLAGQGRVVLSGGCFQNALLTRLARERLTAAGFTVYTHRLVPPNDGGISLGQAVVARLTCV